MKYFIGIDGGATKTKCVITDEELNIIYECSGKPSSISIYNIHEVSETLVELIIECKEKAGVDYREIIAVVIGTAGAGRKSSAEKLKEILLKLVLYKNIKINDLQIVSDARIALEGAFGGGEGSILISGTGSIMFGKDKKGNIHRAGGFGRYIGDEGSAYSIGRKGINLLSKYFDGRTDKPILADLISNKFNIKDSASLIENIYSNDLDIASVAPLVIEAAEQSDSECIKILSEESDELILLVRTMLKKLINDDLKLCFIGSTISNKHFYSNLLKSKIEIALPKVQIVEPKYPPVIGAILLLKNIDST